MSSVHTLQSPNPQASTGPAQKPSIRKRKKKFILEFLVFIFCSHDTCTYIEQKNKCRYARVAEPAVFPTWIIYFDPISVYSYRNHHAKNPRSGHQSITSVGHLPHPGGEVFPMKPLVRLGGDPTGRGTNGAGSCGTGMGIGIGAYTGGRERCW